MSASETLDTLGTTEHGLSADEAAKRLARHGPNQIEAAESVNPWRILLHQFASPLIYILIVAMLITLVTGHVADSIVIALVLSLNATIGFIQEYRAENAMQALMRLVTPTATVRRDGERLDVASLELVPGDVVLLESGDRVPADVRIIEDSHLSTDDSLLTGESVVVVKSAAAIDAGPDLSVGDRKNMAFMGTTVAAGRARAVVVATGGQTELGMIAGEMRATDRVRTPLQTRMHRFGRVVSAVIVVCAALAFLVGLWQGVPATAMFLTAVAIAVAAIPEGLPIVMTVALAVSVRRMAKRNAIVRRLPAVETLGSCTVIMSDKTGTLTENRMTVQEVWSGGERFEVTGAGLSLDGQVRRMDGNDAPETASGEPSIDSNSPLYLTLLAGMLANESDLRRHQDQGSTELIAHGDPTEVALLVAAAKGGLDRENLLDEWARIGDVPFESERQFSATIHQRRGSNETVAFIKGAPERVLEMCGQMHGLDGVLDRKAILEEAHRMAGQGLRLLAMATGTNEDAIESTRRAEPRGLTFLGLVGMMDPPRAEVIEAIRKCHRAGIRVIMCTGDHASTAAAIAEKIGLVPQISESGTQGREARTPVITGAELLDLTDAELKKKIPNTHVFARVSPDQKLRIVNLLRELGEVVAVTGDGVNDAPALKSAHIGCAMGLSGTDVAKEASELVLADDNFATIYAAVEEGRTVFSNIRKAADFLISTSVGVVLAIFGTFVLAAFGVFVMEDGEIPLLLLPAQILWLNVVTNGIQDVALAFEPGEEEQYRQPPRDPNEGLMSRTLKERTTLVGILLAIVALAMFTWELNRHGGETFAERLAYAQAATLTAMVIFKMLHVGACRSETLSIFQKPVFSNRVLFVGASISLAIHLGAMYFPPTQFLLGLQPLEMDTWIVILLTAPSVLVLVELHKLIRRRSSMRS